MMLCSDGAKTHTASAAASAPSPLPAGGSERSAPQRSMKLSEVDLRRHPASSATLPMGRKRTLRLTAACCASLTAPSGAPSCCSSCGRARDWALGGTGSEATGTRLAKR